MTASSEGRHSFRCPTLGQLPSPPSGRSGWPWAEESPQLPDTLPNGRLWPGISIVTPSYNQGRFLEEAIRSVLLQGYPNLEYIVMDGGSSDATVGILDRYNPFFSHLRAGPDGGQAAAISSGFRSATGEIFAYLNSDDRYQRGALARVGTYFAAHPRVVFVNSDVNHIDENSHLIERSHLAGPCPIITANTGWHNWLQQGCFWRRSAYEACGGMDESLQVCMDRDLFVRLTQMGPSRRIGGPPTADFRRHPSAKSETLLDRADKEHTILMERYASPILRRMKGLLALCWGLWQIPARIREWAHLHEGLEL